MEGFVAFDSFVDIDRQIVFIYRGMLLADVVLLTGNNLRWISIYSLFEYQYNEPNHPLNNKPALVQKKNQYYPRLAK